MWNPPTFKKKKKKWGWCLMKFWYKFIYTALVWISTSKLYGEITPGKSLLKKLVFFSTRSCRCSANLPYLLCVSYPRLSLDFKMHSSEITGFILYIGKDYPMKTMLVKTYDGWLVRSVRTLCTYFEIFGPAPGNKQHELTQEIPVSCCAECHMLW